MKTFITITLILLSAVSLADEQENENNMEIVIESCLHDRHIPEYETYAVCILSKLEAYEGIDELVNIAVYGDPINFTSARDFVRNSKRFCAIDFQKMSDSYLNCLSIQQIAYELFISVEIPSNRSVSSRHFRDLKKYCYTTTELIQHPGVVDVSELAMCTVTEVDSIYEISDFSDSAQHYIEYFREEQYNGSFTLALENYTDIF